MKKLMSVFFILLCLSCSTDDISNEEKKPKATPNITWKKLTYTNYKNNAQFQDSIPDFETEGYVSKIEENLGIVEYENQIFNFTKKTTFKDPRTNTIANSTIEFYYTRDSLNHIISIKLDTITLPHKSRFFNSNTSVIKSTLLKEEDNSFTYSIMSKKTELSFLKVDDVRLHSLSDNTSINIINENTTKEITTPAGKFETNEYSIIGKNKTTGERIFKGKSTQYYSQGILIQELESFASQIKYIHKKELTNIEYLD